MDFSNLIIILTNITAKLKAYKILKLCNREDNYSNKLCTLFTCELFENQTKT